MKKQLVIIGAGGQGRVVRDVALLCGYENVIFLDDSEVEDVCVSGKVCDYLRYSENSSYFVAIGNNVVRERITNMLNESNLDVATLIHPSAVLGSNVSVGKGTVVMAGVVINTGAIVGNGVIVNTSSSIDHDDVVEDFSHVSVGAHLAGNVRVGKRAFVCAGATIINNVSVCDDSIVGAGAVVINDLKERGTYVGVPAVMIKNKNA